MTEHEAKERFMELRVQGLSFEEISKELKISKRTLGAWARELRDEIIKRGCNC
jgi:DNA-directed RNA polymerase specialized sigma24 family protein